MANITIIGGGNMGEALVKGLCKTHQVFVCEADTHRAAALKKKYKIITGDLHASLHHAKIIILAIKPQDMSALLGQIKRIQAHCMPEELLYISIAAGLTTKFFEQGLGDKVKVIRTMPNMPALIGEGITALCAGKYASPKCLKAAQEIMSSVGKTIIVKEKDMDAVTAVSGSGPAYVFLFVEEWLNAAKAIGFKEAEAKALVYQTLTGSAHLLEKSAFDAATLRAKVTSKGGTTQAAMDVFLKAKTNNLMKKALLAAKKRAQELAK